MSPTCPFCKGNLLPTILPHNGKEGLSCLQCGRTSDLEHERYVQGEQAKEHKNWQSYSTDRESIAGRKAGQPLKRKKPGPKGKYAG